MRRSMEMLYPAIIGAVSVIVAAAWMSVGGTLPKSENLLSSLVSLGGVFAGFIATAKTIVAGMNKRTLTRLNKCGFASDLRHYLAEGLWVAFALCAMSIVGFTDSLKERGWYIAILFALAAYALACLHRIAVIAMNLLHQNDADTTG